MEQKRSSAITEIMQGRPQTYPTLGGVEAGPTLENSMVELKGLGQGVSLAGDYTVEQWLSGEDGAAFFATSLAGGERALLKVISEEHADADTILATWQRARHLRHPHVLELRDAGRTEITGENYVYAAFEYPDDDLATALEHEPLSEADTRDVLEAALDALRYLHGQGLVHGAIAPKRIVAVGNTIKLATDALRESDGLEGHTEDVRQLGELVRTLLGPGEPSEAFGAIIRHAAEPDSRNRWTLAEIARIIPAPVVPAAVPAAAPVPPPPSPEPITPVA